MKDNNQQTENEILALKKRKWKKNLVILSNYDKETESYIAISYFEMKYLPALLSREYSAFYTINQKIILISNAKYAQTHACLHALNILEI